MTARTTANPWVMGHKPTPKARVRLFCFPYAGGGASIFRDWVKKMPPEIEVFPIQLPGRENRLSESPFTQITALTQNLAQALQPYLNMPFAFLGHSMGALICFELARYLRGESNRTAVHLFVSGRKAPQIPYSFTPVHQLSDEAFIAELRQLQGTPANVLQNNELMELMMPVLRADFALVESYLYVQETALTCPITAFGGLDDEDVSYDDLSAWNEQTQGSFKLRMFPGGHFFLHNNQPRLLRAISQDLKQYIHSV